jgi:transcriptional regulator with GAF, ATPase, and Fis domain
MAQPPIPEISTSISPEQLAALLRRMEAERQVIAEIVHALNQTANLDELLAGIHQALKKVLPAENCFVALHDSVTDAFSFPFFVDQVDPAPPPPQKAGHSCSAYVFRKGVPMLIPQSVFDQLAAEGEVELVGALRLPG